MTFTDWSNDLKKLTNIHGYFSSVVLCRQKQFAAQFAPTNAVGEQLAKVQSWGFVVVTS